MSVVQLPGGVAAVAVLLAAVVHDSGANVVGLVDSDGQLWKTNPPKQMQHSSKNLLTSLEIRSSYKFMCLRLKIEYIASLQPWARSPDECTSSTKVKTSQVEYQVGNIF